jgi:hypothetical protein
MRLVPNVTGRSDSVPQAPASDDAEIRLTYRELSTLIEEAIRNLR